MDVPFAMIGLPLFCAGRVVGMIHIILNEVGQMFAPEEQLLLERFAGLASIAYDNAFLYNQAQTEIAERKLIEEKLRYMSLHDALTGLYNRTYFEVELARIADGRNKSVGIIVCDLDGLKKVNDALGHAFGDALIIAAGDALKKSFRKSDMVARIGGDEFVILLPEADQAAMEAAEERMREQVSNYPEVNGEKLSISMGWAVGKVPGNDLRKLFERADKKMYLDKFSKKFKVF
jgi:diguanylate cyclase (GGDEF)-like protein